MNFIPQLNLSTDWIAQEITQWAGGPHNPSGIYNTLVNGFNVSTVMLATAVALAVFANFQLAIIVGALGSLLRHVTDKELLRYQAPNREILDPVVLTNYSLGVPIQDARENIIANTGRRAIRMENWEITRLTICDIPLFKNKVTVIENAE